MQIITYDNNAILLTNTSSFTVGVHSNRILLVFGSSGNSDPTGTLSYGGQAMTSLGTVAGLNNNTHLTGYYLVNPPTGANSFSSSGTAGNGGIAVDSRYNAYSIGQPDAIATAADSSPSSGLGASVTTVHKGAVVVGCAFSISGGFGAFTLGSNMTNNGLANNNGSNQSWALADGGTVSTPTSFTQTATHSTSYNDSAFFQISIIPAPEAFTITDTITPADHLGTFARAATFTKLDSITSTDHLGLFARAATFTVLNTMSLIDATISIIQKWNRQTKNISAETNVNKSSASAWTDNIKHISSETNQPKN